MIHIVHRVVVLNSDCSEKSSEVCVKVMTVVFIRMITCLFSDKTSKLEKYKEGSHKSPR